MHIKAACIIFQLLIAYLIRDSGEYSRHISQVLDQRSALKI